MDSSLPVDPGKRCALSLGNRDYRHVTENAVEGLQIGNIQPTVQGGHIDSLFSAANRKMQVVDMEMKYVDVLSLAENFFQHKSVVRQRVSAFVVQTQTRRHYGHAAGPW